MRNDHSAPSESSSPRSLAELGYVRYTGSVPFEELELPNEPANPDFQWAWQNTELQRQYAGKIVAVSGRVVWGAGRTIGEAWEEARKNSDCPPCAMFAFVPFI